MGSVNPAGNATPIPRIHEMEIRVRYQETDAQGHVHHSNYLNYFEVARTEMLRSSGRSYRELETEGIMLVVVKATCDYRQGAKYDDLLTIKTTLVKAKGVRITHHYEIRSPAGFVCEGETIVAAVDTQGNVRRLPAWLQVS
jgi:acyl-CoA thioester hydrolase